MTIKIYPDNPSQKEIDRVADLLRGDGLIVYPTDSVYAFGCSVRSMKALERMKAIKGKKNTELALVFDSIGGVAEYARVDNAAFRMLKRNLPGAFTFVLNASSRVPAKALEKRKTVGIRIPSNPIAAAIVRALGEPMLTTSVKDDDQVVEYTTDPELIAERYGHLVDAVVDGGYGDNVPTTLVDLTVDEPVILRPGKGVII